MFAHFLPEQMIQKSDRITLLPNIIPVVFDYMIEVIDIDSTDINERELVQCEIQEKHRNIIKTWKKKMALKHNEILSLKRKVVGLQKRISSYAKENKELKQKVVTLNNPKKEIVSW